MAEDNDVFEITDFTNATPWEGFISGLENVIHQWGLDRTEDIYSRGGDVLQHRKSEKLVYGNKTFTVTYHVGPSGRGPSSSGGNVRGTSGKADEDIEEWTVAMRDMLDRRNDFPASAHHISRWFGVQEFVVITTTRENESLISETQAKLVISSITIAAKNTGCATPIFVQIQFPWRQMYIGVCEGGGVRTSFDVIHLRQTPPPYNHLSGLLEVFKSKLEVGGVMPPVEVSVRFTYSLKHWDVDDWLATTASSKTCGEVSSLPFGVTKDPIEELHLSTLWPHLTEEVVVDNNHHSDLTPLSAPTWTVRTKLSTMSPGLAATNLGNLLKLAYCLDPIDQIIADLEEEGPIVGGTNSPSNVLNKLTESKFESRFKGRRFLRSTLEAGMGRLQTAGLRWEMQQLQATSDELDATLMALFPDAEQGVDPQEPSPKMLKSFDDRVGRECSFLRMKMSPMNGLVDRLAFTICKIANKSPGVQAVAQVWKEVVEELRYRWENSHLIPNVSEGPPDFATCLLHQKLQMLNCCVRAKQAASSKRKEGSVSSHSQQDTQAFVTPNSSFNVKNEDGFIRKSSEGQPSNDDEDDEFFEAQEEFVEEIPSSNQSQETVDNSHSSSNVQHDMETGSDTVLEDDNHGNSVPSSLFREGALHPYKDLLLIATGEKLFVPKTQDPGPLTEDMILEQEKLMAKLGTSEEAAKIRAKLQSGSLLSDMQAFKAANPGCLLEDFVRWYSPRDWIEGEEEEVMTSLPDNTTPLDPSTGSSKDSAPTKERLQYEETGEGDGWEDEDWDVVIEDEQKVDYNNESGDGQERRAEEEDVKLQTTPKYAVGHLSVRMQQSDSTWREAWNMAEPIPVDRQKQLFDATKEAEKVLHYLSSMSPSQLTLQLLPNLFEHTIVEMKKKLEIDYVGLRCAWDPFTGLCDMLQSMYSCSLESLPKLQECVKLLEQVEFLLSAAESLDTKFARGLETKAVTVSEERAQELRRGVISLLDNNDLLVKKSSKSPISLALHGLLAAQIASQDTVLDKEGKKINNEFPPPVGREYLLRCIVKCPSPDSTPTPQRMFVVITKDEFRIAGAFSSDSNA